LFWGTELTWGDKVEWYRDGRRQVAMLVLLSKGTSFEGVLWGLEGDFVGDSGRFDLLTEADKAKVEGSDGSLFISTVHQTEL
jgi:hypothetical protein